MPGKVKYHELSEHEKKTYLGDFYSMVSLLKTRDEVKNFFKDLAKKKVLKIITKNPILPKKKEKGFNPRARSAKLWVAVKL